MIVKQLISKEIVRVGKDATLREVAKVMREKDVSSVLLTDGDEAVGIVTERDVTGAVAEGLDYNTPAERLAKRPLITIEGERNVYEALELMGQKRIRHLVVTEGGKPVGIVSLREVANTIGLMMAEENRY